MRVGGCKAGLRLFRGPCHFLFNEGNRSQTPRARVPAPHKIRRGQVRTSFDFAQDGACPYARRFWRSVGG
jgi:hypothetical protein